MSDVAIRVEHLYKQYRLGLVSTGTLSHDLNRWWHKARGKEDPYLKISAQNDRTEKTDSEYVWALEDINFEVKKGEVLGIIGRNGAGKSTLLKILSKVTGPTKGSIKVNGRIASLLEVGTGFHPELTGRENIFLNGAILGMTKAEVKSKFDEIVNFSGVERYIDTPVKRYSSGMYVRLAFAVAAHLEPEILIVDEVLAVGDAEFQKKCLGKMKDVSEHGRTILFVSHNIAAVRRLCNKGILIQNGMLYKEGSIETVTDLYIKGNTDTSSRIVRFNAAISSPIIITEVAVFVEGKEPDAAFDIADSIKVNIKYTVTEDLIGTNMACSISKEGITLFRTWDIDNDTDLFNNRKKGEYSTKLTLPDFLSMGSYAVTIACGRSGVGAFVAYEDVLFFDIENVKTDGSHASFTRGGLLKANISWQTKRV